MRLEGRPHLLGLVFRRTLLATNLTLTNGVHVRLRLPQAADRPLVEDLHARLGADPPGDLTTARSMHFDPRASITLCATAWIGGTEQFVGYGAIERDARSPFLLICDDDAAPGVRQALNTALVEATGDRRAA